MQRSPRDLWLNAAENSALRRAFPARPPRTDELVNWLENREDSDARYTPSRAERSDRRAEASHARAELRAA